MDRINSYPKVWNLGHPAIADLLDGPVTVEEKLDGSQFSFGLIDGKLVARSRNQQLDIDAPEKMFGMAIETIVQLRSLLIPGYIYRAEYLSKCKHNTLAYDRVPNGCLMVFDIQTGLETYMDSSDRARNCARLGLESIPVVAYGKLDSFDDLQTYLSMKSILGGTAIEGVVIKNYQRFGRDGKALMGKMVSEKFKELHTSDWKSRHPGGGDIKHVIGMGLRSEARWEKAIQHLSERGELQNAPEDIGPLMKEINIDTQTECAEIVKEQLYKWAWKHISRQVTAGFPEWYKERLAKEQFSENDQSLRT